MEATPAGALHYSGAMKPYRARQAAPLRTDLFPQSILHKLFISDRACAKRVTLVVAGLCFYVSLQYAAIHRMSIQPLYARFLW